MFRDVCAAPPGFLRISVRQRAARNEARETRISGRRVGLRQSRGGSAGGPALASASPREFRVISWHNLVQRGCGGRPRTTTRSCTVCGCGRPTAPTRGDGVGADRNRPAATAMASGPRSASSLQATMVASGRPRFPATAERTPRALPDGIGFHSALWFGLGTLFCDAQRLRPFVGKFADRLRPHRAAPVLRRNSLRQANILPASQRTLVTGRRVAIADHMISAGASVRATHGELTRRGARVVVVAALAECGGRVFRRPASAG